jgi:hypothetical protein
MRTRRAACSIEHAGSLRYRFVTSLLFVTDFVHYSPDMSGDLLAIWVAVLMSLGMCTALGFFVEAQRPRD